MKEVTVKCDECGRILDDEHSGLDYTSIPVRLPGQDEIWMHFCEVQMLVEDLTIYANRNGEIVTIEDCHYDHRYETPEFVDLDEEDLTPEWDQLLDLVSSSIDPDRGDTESSLEEDG